MTTATTITEPMPATAANDSGSIRIEDLASAIANAVSARVPLSVKMWDSADIADYLRYERNFVTRNVITDPTFPAKFDIGHGRWRAQEVIDWALSKRTVAPAKPGRKRQR